MKKATIDLCLFDRGGSIGAVDRAVIFNTNPGSRQDWMGGAGVQGAFRQPHTGIQRVLQEDLRQRSGNHLRATRRLAGLSG